MKLDLQFPCRSKPKLSFQMHLNPTSISCWWRLYLRSLLFPDTTLQAVLEWIPEELLHKVDKRSTRISRLFSCWTEPRLHTIQTRPPGIAMVVKYLMYTSAKKTYVIKPSRVWVEVLRSCLSGSVIQFTRLFPDYVIVTLAPDFSFTADVTLVDGSYWDLLEDKSV